MWVRCVMCAMLLAWGAAPAAAQGSGSPYTLADVTRLLRDGLPQGRLAERAGRHCISFAMDERSEREIRRAGGTAAFLDRLRAACTVRGVDAATTTTAAPPAPPARVGLDVRSVSLRFFQRGPNGPSMPSGPVETRFSRATTRFVGVLLEMAYASAPGGRPRVTCAYLKPNGEPFFETYLEMTFSPSGGRARDAGGVGFDTAGLWRPGTYHVECRVDEQVVGRGAFEIY